MRNVGTAAIWARYKVFVLWMGFLIGIFNSYAFLDRRGIAAVFAVAGALVTALSLLLAFRERANAASTRSP